MSSIDANTQVVPSNEIPDYGWTSIEPEKSHDYLQPVVLRVLDSLRRSSGRQVLRVFDAGCGNGALLRRLQQARYEIAGCDASESGVAQARSVCSKNIRVERMSVYEDLASVFGDAWDVVVATEVIEHLYAPRDFVGRIQRLLVPGGVVVLTTPYHGYLKNLVMSATGSLDAHFTALWDGGHIKFWSYRTLTTLLREYGFGSFAFYGAGRLPWLWKSMVVVGRKAA